MKVNELFTKVGLKTVMLCNHHRPDIHLSGWIEAWREIRATTPTSADFQVAVELHDNGEGTWWGVHGLPPDENGYSWALEFVPWPEWLAAEVIPNPSLTDEQMAMHILDEMTWAGFSNAQVQERADELFGREEQ